MAMYDNSWVYPDGPPARKCLVCIALDALPDEWHCGEYRCKERWGEWTRCLNDVYMMGVRKSAKASREETHDMEKSYVVQGELQFPP